MNTELTKAQRLQIMEADIAKLRREVEVERKALAESVKPVYRYIIELNEDKFDRIYDPAVTLYRITGVCLNQDEIDAVGGRSHTGSMSYLFNKATGRIIMPHGGGSVFISGSLYRRHSDEVSVTYNKIETFLITHPDGGDITEIIEAHQQSIAK